MKYNISVDDCKFSEKKLDEIFAMGGIPAPQDGTFRLKKGTIEQGYINERRSRGYEIRESESNVEFLSPEGESYTLQKGTIEAHYIAEQKRKGYRVREAGPYLEFV